MLVGVGQVGKVGSQGERGLLAGATAVLDFVNNGLDANFTFTRASSGTYFNSAGTLSTALTDEPRLDHNPTTLAARALLMEGGRTNIAGPSSDLSDASFVPQRASLAVGAITGVNGLATMAKLVEDNANNSHFLAKNVTVVSGTKYCWSLEVKKGERDRIQMLHSSSLFGVTNWCDYNLTTGTVETNGGGGTAGIIPLGNGHYRIYYVATATGNGSTNAFDVAILPTGSSSRLPSYLGDGTSGLYVGNFQVEAGVDFPSSYIDCPTSSSVARASDLCSKTNLAALSFNDSEGTIVVEFESCGVSVGQALISFEKDSFNGFILRRSNVTASNLSFVVRTGGVDQTSFAGFAVNAFTLSKIAMAYKENDCAFVANGGTVQTDTSVSVPTGITTMYLGNGNISAPQPGFYWIRKITYFPYRKSNAELQALTS